MFARLRRALPARRPRADQPDLAVGPVPRRRLDERRAARLVPRLADRRAAARARLRRHDRQLHARAEPVLGRRAVPGRRLRDPLPLAVARAALHAATAASTTCSTGRATHRGGRRSAPRSSRGCSWSSSPARPTASTSRFGIPTSRRLGLSACSSVVLPLVALVVTHRVCIELQRGERGEAAAACRLARAQLGRRLEEREGGKGATGGRGALALGRRGARRGGLRSHPSNLISFGRAKGARWRHRRGESSRCRSACACSALLDTFLLWTNLGISILVLVSAAYLGLSLKQALLATVRRRR